MTYDEILRHLKANANPAAVEGMARFGIRTDSALGLSMPFLRQTAKSAGVDHALALKLWQSGIHEARILAALVDDPAQVTSAQMERWVKDFDSWDVCDQVCGNLFDRTRFGRRKAVTWAGRKSEFVRRAGFALIAALAWQDRQADDELFVGYLALVEEYAFDDRNFVKKAVNWALRTIGKHSPELNAAALTVAEQLASSKQASPRWVGKDAHRELASAAVRERLRARPGKVER